MSYEMQWVDRLYELMDRLSTNLAQKGVIASPDETLTSLINKIDQI